LAVHFHRLAPAALALNLLAVPLSGAVLLCGLATLAGAALVPPLAPWLGDAAWIAAHALLRSGEAARFAAWLDLRVPTPGLLAVALLAAGLLLVARGRRLRTAAALVSLGMLGHVVGPGSPPADGLLHVTVLDVGQGDCLVLRTPSGRVRLVDGGGSYEGGFDVGERVVGPYLWSQGIRSIDALLLTHAHPDHVGGAAFLARVFQPAEVWEGPAPQHDPTYAALDAGLRVLPTARRAVAAGMHDAWEGIPVHVLGPRPRRPWRTRNDDSLVAWLRFGSVAVLLPGDAEANEGSELPPAPAAILKAPHHGSRTSSTPAFVRATAPAVVVISSGRMNRFGHPHPEVVERYRRLGARVYRTDQDGAVSVATDGLRVWVRTFERGSWQRIR
jgi:competence protein ComEC